MKDIDNTTGNRELIRNEQIKQLTYAFSPPRPFQLHVSQQPIIVGSPVSGSPFLTICTKMCYKN